MWGKPAFPLKDAVSETCSKTWDGGGLRRHERQLQMIDNPVHNGILRDEIDDLYRPPALGADHRVNLIDLPDYGRPILGMAPFLLRLDCHIPLFSQKPNSVGAFSPISQILATPL